MAAYSTFSGDETTQKMAWDWYRTFLVPTEIHPDGSCPREEARTDSLSYSAMNLDAFSVVCRIAEVNGVNLWRYRTPQGIDVQKSFRYLTPYILHPETWKKPQLAKFNPEGTFFQGFAGLGLGDEALLAAYKSMSRNRSPWLQFIDLAVRA